jgi:hypothetical protein
VLFRLNTCLEGVTVFSTTQETAKVIQPDGQKVFWSRIDSFECYWSLQQQIRAIAKPVVPLEYEMRNLWVAD